jgi:hypothetical protein
MYNVQVKIGPQLLVVADVSKAGEFMFATASRNRIS